MESSGLQPMESFALDDQASGLRQQVRKLGCRLPSIEQRRCRLRTLEVPHIRLHLPLDSKVPIQIGAGTLVWHWQTRSQPAFGWDMQARLHVVGIAEQFTTTQLSKWRYLFRDWHLIGESLELSALADSCWLWLGGGESLIARLRPVLSWLCRNRPDIPIIFAGIEGATRERLERWASTRYPLRFLKPHDLPSGAEHGYYRLLRRAISLHAW